jgi:uncharacterized protein (TIGR02246 family)
MPATTPEQLYQELAEAFNAGDLERLMTLYEPAAILVAGPGQNMAGTEQVRAALQGFLALNGAINVDVKEVIQTGDLALAAASWSVAGTGPDGKPVTLRGVSSDVLRRQPAGDWRWVIDQPWGDQMTTVD